MNGKRLAIHHWQNKVKAGPLARAVPPAQRLALPRRTRQRPDRLSELFLRCDADSVTRCLRQSVGPLRSPSDPPAGANTAVPVNEMNSLVQTGGRSANFAASSSGLILGLPTTAFARLGYGHGAVAQPGERCTRAVKVFSSGPLDGHETCEYNPYPMICVKSSFRQTPRKTSTKHTNVWGSLDRPSASQPGRPTVANLKSR